MDDQSFDTWVRHIASGGISRRGGLRLAVGAGVAALVGRAEVGEAAACRNDGKECSRPGQCCSGKCEGRRGKETCRGGKQPFGCKVSQNSCRGGLEPCPQKDEGTCFQLDSGEAFCAGFFSCRNCQQDNDCQSAPGLGRPRCIKDCPTCRRTRGNPSACVFPNAPFQ